jgi:hypothetical protein
VLACCLGAWLAGDRLRCFGAEAELTALLHCCARALGGLGGQPAARLAYTTCGSLALGPPDTCESDSASPPLPPSPPRQPPIAPAWRRPHCCGPVGLRATRRQRRHRWDRGTRHSCPACCAYRPDADDESPLIIACVRRRRLSATRACFPLLCSPPPVWLTTCRQACKNL